MQNCESGQRIRRSLLLLCHIAKNMWPLIICVLILAEFVNCDSSYYSNSYSSSTSCVNGVCTTTICEDGECTTTTDTDGDYEGYYSDEYYDTTTAAPAHTAAPAPAPAPSVSAHYQCGDYAKPSQQFVQKIIGGRIAKRNGWPWIVSLQYRDQHFCAGSLIRVSTSHDVTDIVVTAAHCLRGRSRAYFNKCIAKAGDHDLSSQDASEQQSGFKEIYTSSEYDPDTGYANDIGFIVLGTKMKFTTGVRPVCLPKTTAQAGQMLYAVGWGDTSEGGFISDHLKQVKVPMVSASDCRLAYGNAWVGNSMICAGWPKGGAGTCQGDSGGPLVSEHDGRFFLQGITSFGKGCAQAGKPGVYTKVSWFCHFLQENVCKHSAIPGSCSVTLCQ